MPNYFSFFFLTNMSLLSCGRIDMHIFVRIYFLYMSHKYPWNSRENVVKNRTFKMWGRERCWRISNGIAKTMQKFQWLFICLHWILIDFHSFCILCLYGAVFVAASIHVSISFRMLDKNYMYLERNTFLIIKIRLNSRWQNVGKNKNARQHWETTIYCLKECEYRLAKFSFTRNHIYI